MSKKDKQTLIKNKLTEIIRYSSLSRMKSFAQKDDFEIIKLNKRNMLGKVQANLMAVILISGVSLNIIFKAHFNSIDAKRISSSLNINSDIHFSNNTKDHQEIDFILEYCNLTGGHISKVLEKLNVDVGLSLPVCARGFYEIFSDYNDNKFSIVNFGDIWKLNYGYTSIICSSLIEILNINQFNHIADYNIKDILEPEEDEGIDFL